MDKYINGNCALKTIMVSTPENEHYRNAVLFDLKSEEIILESSIEPKPGSDLNIWIENDSEKNSCDISPKNFHGKVKRCEEHLDGYTFSYRVSVQLSEPVSCVCN